MQENFIQQHENLRIPERSDNLRKKELQSRSETLNEEEEAELKGLYVFPDNPRGAELRKKEALGLITDEEKEELKRLYQLKTRQEKNTPAVQKLWERVEANDPNVEQVAMGNAKSVEVTPDGEEKVLWTFGLGGCYCAVVFTEQEDGTRDCVLTHYPSTELSTNLRRLDYLLGNSEKIQTAMTKKVVLALPGEWVQDPETEKYEMVTQNLQDLQTLTSVIQGKLGTDVDIKSEPYSENISFEQKNQGTLIVYVPPAGKGDVRYQTWYSEGKLTDESGSKE